MLKTEYYIIYAIIIVLKRLRFVKRFSFFFCLISIKKTAQKQVCEGKVLRGKEERKGDYLMALRRYAKGVVFVIAMNCLAK